jgi:hypothetical protein
MGELDTAADRHVRPPRGIIRDAIGDDPVLQFLSEHVKTGQPTLVYPYAPVYYFLSAARNPTRYSFTLYQLNTEAQFREVVQSLESSDVRYVVWDRSSLDSMHLWFPAYRIPPPNELMVEPYLLDAPAVPAVLALRSGANRQRP